MSIADDWSLLAIAPTDDKREVKRAYGRALKKIDVDSDPAAFVRLRQAMEAALTWGTQVPWWEEDEEEQEQDERAAEAAPRSDEQPTLGEEVEAGETEDEPYPFSLGEGWDDYRPQTPSVGEGSLARLCGELDDCLFGEALPKPGRVAELGGAILEDSELEQVDRAVATEAWLASAIAASPPRSDPLIEPAIRRFGWDRARHGWRRDFDVEQVMARREDLVFLARCRREGHPHQRAVKALSEPPPGRLGLLGVSFAADVRSFLAVVEREHPSVESDLDPEALGWWRRYFEGPYLSPHFWLWLLGLPPFLILFALIVLLGSGQRPPILALYFGFLLLTILGLVAAARARPPLRRWKERRREASFDVSPPPGIERTAAAALALPLAAALLPTHPATLILFWAAAAAVAWGPLLRPWASPTSLYDEGTRARVFLPVVAAVVSSFLAIGLPPLPAWELVAPLAAMCLLGALWHDAVRARLLTLPAAARLRLLQGALLLWAVAGLATFFSLSEWPAWQNLAVLAPVAIVSVHLATSATAADPHGLEWPLRAVLVLFYFATNHSWPGGFAEAGLILSAGYGLGYALIRLIAGLGEAL